MKTLTRGRGHFFFEAGELAIGQVFEVGEAVFAGRWREILCLRALMLRKGAPRRRRGGVGGVSGMGGDLLNEGKQAAARTRDRIGVLYSIVAGLERMSTALMLRVLKNKYKIDLLANL
jgi:hypothetical protein